MKKYTYCAKDLQDKDILYGYCNRRAGGISFLRIIILVILGILILHAIIFKNQIQKFFANLRARSAIFNSTKEVGGILQEGLKQGINDVIQASQDFLNEVKDAREVIEDLPESMRNHHISIEKGTEGTDYTDDDSKLNHKSKSRIEIEVKDE